MTDSGCVGVGSGGDGFNRIEKGVLHTDHHARSEVPRLFNILKSDIWQHLNAVQADDQRQALQRALRRARREAGLKQVDVAARLAVPQSFVSKYETGQRRLDLVDLLAVCTVIQINLSDLLALFEAEQKKAIRNEA